VQKVKDDDHGEGYGPQKNVTGLDQGAEDLEAGRNQGHNSQSALLRSKRKSFLDDNGPSKEPHPSDSDEFVSNQTRDQFDALEGPIHLIEPLSGKELNASSWGAHPKQLEHLLDRKKAPEPDADCSKAPSPPLKVGKDTNRDAIEFQAVERFLEAVKDPKKTNQYIFRLYRDLPSPGVAHLSKRTRGLLLRRMSQPPNRRWADARRYLAIVEDMIAAKLPLSPALWTSAIHLAGRAMGHVKKQDLVRSIGIWQQMEHLAGIESDPVVFTILFDIAIKASQFTVADRLLQEMSKRGIEFRRAGKVSKIYYYGMLRDVNGIHRAFDEFLAAGEIVDTAVLNCLMTSFIRAGKIRIAESLYERMMQAQAAARPAGDTGHKGVSSTHQPALASELMLYRKAAKELNRAFEMATRIKHTLPAHHRALQESIPMSPDTRTFHIFLSYHAIHSGNLQAFSKIVDDMEKTFAIPPRGMIYLLLFEGFARYGRKKKGWTADKLRFAWRSYVRALYESRTRLNGDFSIHRPALTWENPLKTDSPTVMTTLADSSRPTVGLYTPLPSSTGETKAVSNVSERADGSNVPSISEIKDTPEQNEVQHNSQRMDEKEDETNDGEQIIELDDGIDLDVDDLFLAPTESATSDSDPMEHELGRRIENGVFLGRRMILLIIRAFGTCCGPEEVMDVWLSLERIWRPQKRKSLDVLAVKEELNRYIKDLTGR
jgi:pentatricopeptide repeat protein